MIHPSPGSGSVLRRQLEILEAFERPVCPCVDFVQNMAEHDLWYIAALLLYYVYIIMHNVCICIYIYIHYYVLCVYIYIYIYTHAYHMYVCIKRNICPDPIQKLSNNHGASGRTRRARLRIMIMIIMIIMIIMVMTMMMIMMIMMIMIIIMMLMV